MENHSILVRTINSAEQWREPETQDYVNEDHLQKLLADDPTRIPGVTAESKAVRELQTFAGPIDICVVGPDGTITVVECKLKKNPEPRRMVLGQMIDYASSLREGGLKSFMYAWQKRGGHDLKTLLGDEGFGVLETNIQTGVINLCLAVDRIDKDIQRLVEYSNLISPNIAVTALQLRYAKYGDIEILIPETFGHEIAESKSRSSNISRMSWTWESFINALSTNSDQELARELKRRIDATPSTGKYDKFWYGTQPSGGIYFQIHGENYSPFQLWQNSNSQLCIFGHWQVWRNLHHDDRFAELAKILGQSHTEGPKATLVSKLDIDKFWEIAIECDIKINS